MVFCFVLSQRPMWCDNIFRNSLQEYSICHQVSALPGIKPKPTTSNLLCWTKPSAVCSLPLLKVTCLLPGVQWKLLQRRLHTSILLFRHHSFLMNCCACALIPPGGAEPICGPAQLMAAGPAVQPPSAAWQDQQASHLSRNTPRHRRDPAPTSSLLSKWLWGYDVNNMYQRSPVFVLMCNTVQNKMEFTFKIKLLYRAVYAQRTLQGKKLWGVSVMKDIIYLCLNKKV